MRHFALVGLIFASVALAQENTGPRVSYIPKKDAMTDANQSYVVILENNDTTGESFLGVKCDGKGSFEVFLKTKNQLLTQEDFNKQIMPKVMYRIDSLAPKTLTTLYTTFNGTPDLRNLAFTSAGDQELHKAFIKANVLRVRILRNGMSNLDYTFNLTGYIYAFSKINGCK